MSRENEGPNKPSRRTFLKISAGLAAGAAAATVVPIQFAGATTTSEEAKASQQKISSLQSELGSAKTKLSTLQGKVSNLQSTSTTLQTQLTSLTAFLTLSTSEQSLLEAVAETIIPSDSNGPGAKEAGAIYFIDRVLAGDYGKNGNMYMEGPFAASGMAGPLIVDGITYPDGSPVQRVDAATRYQYRMSIREFFRFGLDALETYANSAYGGNFETLSAATQLTCLQDLWNGKPTSFSAINPVDFAYELTMLVWCGFLMDPIYGGNQNMVGWQYVAFNGTNQGDFYGEGMTTKQLMVATTPTRLQPASLGQYQQGSSGSSSSSSSSSSTSASTTASSTTATPSTSTTTSGSA